MTRKKLNLSDEEALARRKKQILEWGRKNRDKRTASTKKWRLVDNKLQLKFNRNGPATGGLRKAVKARKKAK